MSSSATNALIAGITKFTRVEGRPKAWDIVRLDNEMQEKAQCIPAGDGDRNGQVGMVLSKKEWTKRMGEQEPEWEPPRGPGTYPNKKQTETKESYEARIHVWNKRKDTAELYTLGESTMRTNFFEAFDPEFTKGLRKQKAGSYTQITMMDCLTYMKEKYGKWGVQEIKNNEARLDETWNGRGSIEVILDKFEEIEELAEMAEAPIPTFKMITKLMEVIEPVAEFGPAIREIMMHGVKAWSWEGVKDHLIICDEARQANTTAGKGYHAANEAREANAAKAEEGDGSANKKGKRASLIDENGLMTRKTTKYQAIATYCHSHGTSFDNNHSSDKCKSPKKGHNNKATIYNQMGGSTEFSTPEKWRVKRGRQGGEQGGEERSPK
jgi:hypothetical protein